MRVEPLNTIAMKHFLFFALLTVAGMFYGYGQEPSLKEQALEAFKREHYGQAIDLLKRAALQTPNDAEVFYYLGWFHHYQAYDSRPLAGYDYAYSEQIFEYLDKALMLNPNYGDAKYFYGAECSGNAFIAMQHRDVKKLRHYYRLANEKGAYPAWLKEFGRNLLSTCERDAILFTGGNADFDICTYLQLHEGMRTDVTLIPIGNIDRPWYVQFLKEGLKDGVRKIEIRLTEQQIMDIHPFKWKPVTVSVSISSVDKIGYGLPEDYTMQWEVHPDLQSDRMHSKIVGEEAQKRSYLSPQRAVLLQIIEDNFRCRPVYFTRFCSPAFYGGLETNFRNEGLISRLLPFPTEGTAYASDKAQLLALLQPERLQNLKKLPDTDIPRISGIVLYGYYSSLSALLEVATAKEVEELQTLFRQYLKIGFNPAMEEQLERDIYKRKETFGRR